MIDIIITRKIFEMKTLKAESIVVLISLLSVNHS